MLDLLHEIEEDMGDIPDPKAQEEEESWYTLNRVGLETIELDWFERSPSVGLKQLLIPRLPREVLVPELVPKCLVPGLVREWSSQLPTFFVVWRIGGDSPHLP